MSGESETTRKSARIAAIEEEKRKEKIKRAATSSVSGQTDPRRGGISKTKSFGEIARTSSSPSTQQVGGEKNKNRSIRNGLGDLQSVHPLPEKHFLENALDILQRRDKRDLFTHPVDVGVEDYYEVIAEPMDFSTLRAKLWTDAYKTLEQFEHDVMLISENAMFFNGENTLYYKQARVLFELSKRVLEILKRDPEKLQQLERDLSQEQRRPVQRCRGNAGSSCTNKRGKPQAYRSLSSNLHSEQGGQKMNSGSQRHGARTFIPDRDSYKPSEFIVSELNDDPKTFVLGDGLGIGYKESLMKFVKNLGPIAQKVAAERLSKLSAMASNLPSTRSPVPLPVAASCLQERNLFSTSSSVSRASSSGDWQGRSLTDKGKNVIIESPAPPSPEIFQPADRQFLRQFMNDVRSTDYNGFDSPPASYRPTPVRDERFQQHQNFSNQIGSYHLSESRAQDVNNHITGITTGSHLHNRVPPNQLRMGSQSSLDVATPTNDRRSIKQYVYPSTYLRPSRFSGTSLHSSQTGTSSTHGYAGSSAQVNLSPVVEATRPTVDIPFVNQGQPMGPFLRLLTMDEDPSEQEAQSAAAANMQAQSDTVANLVCQNSSRGSISVPGMGRVRNPYPQRLGLNEPEVEEQSQGAGGCQVYGQWRSTLTRDPRRRERQLMPPPGERSKCHPPPPGF